LIAADQSDYQVDLGQTPLLSGQVHVILELLSDSLGKLVPIEITYHILNVLLVKAIIQIILRECAHVDFNQIVVLERPGESKSGTSGSSTQVVLYRTETLRETVQCV